MKTLGTALGLAVATLLVACGGKEAGSILGDPDGGGGGGGDGGSTLDGGGRSDSGQTQPPKNHRAVAVACSASPVPAEPDLKNTQFSPNATFECKKNEECTKQLGGRCAIFSCDNFGGPACMPQGTRCDYDACASDLDCNGGAVCECGTGEGGTNRCVASSCRVDADCGTDGYCSPSVSPCSNLVEGYYCHSTADLCRSDSDCANNGGLGGLCMYTGNHWECNAALCAAAAAAP